MLKKIFKENSAALLQTEDWLSKIWQGERKIETEGFKKLGKPICDIIICNKFPLVFGTKNKVHNQQFKALLLTNNVPVQYVYKHAKKGQVSIHLKEGSKDFTMELLQNLATTLDIIRAQTALALDATHATIGRRSAELSRIHLTQIDYT